MKLSAKDQKKLNDKNISEKVFKNQLQTFKDGIPHVSVLDYAHVGKGIKRIDDEKLDELTKIYEQVNIEVLKFIPASGAATRMFKAVHQFINEIEIDDNSISKALDTKEYALLKPLIKNMDKLAFYKQASNLAQEKNEDFDNFSNFEKAVLVLKIALSEDGLNLAELPKGLIPFHEYSDKTLTPFEEHLDEAKYYAAKDNKAQLHFTISEQHEHDFETVLQDYLKTKNNNINYQVEFSYQKESTDTIAVNMDNSPYRDENGHLFFRPGGHGALIHNLNTIHADLIFIKNIDNVSKKAADKKDTTTYKKVLGGLLIKLQKQIFDYQHVLEIKSSDDLVEEVRSFMKNQLLIKNPAHEPKELIKQLHKPIRVCGMVKNDGAPGGGPFWVEDTDNEQSLQIVETSQMNLDDEKQKQILKNATHFNPVDIVCGVKDYRGTKFDLLEYVNTKRGFITQKSIEGQPIKALELPGLWNGAMEYWHSIFVEIPITTFNPVKTVVDLLKPAHQDN